MPPLEVPALPPTRRLFDEDPSRLAFDARVFAMTPGASDAGRSGPEVALDATAFFAEDGGQLSDRGSIAGIPVLGVRIDPQGTIWHLLTHDPPPEAAWREGAIVHGEVDARVRRDRRQQHSGQHLLSRAFSVVLGRETVSFHMGED
ncbi:MAG: hypothetical protein QUU85_00075, partial [Candidatus Eisenbacteria bacterium]|nr:hypothetical protein [Candidatus Eisenbacteria bacterium]